MFINIELNWWFRFTLQCTILCRLALQKWYENGDFYTNSDAMQYFNNRIAHTMAYVNPHSGKTWAESPEYISALEIQNEAMHDNHGCPVP